MAKLRVHGMSMSLDGFTAGPNQTLEEPKGDGGAALHDWVFATAGGQAMIGQPVTAEPTIDDELFFDAAWENIGAHVMGRNMFGPIRGEWPDDSWKGWWGDTPPYHHAVYVLTHHPRQSFEMDGGTTFHFVTDGIESALSQAFAAADGQDVRLGGGASAVRQYLQAGLIDEMHIAVVPVLLGSGESLFGDLDLPALGYDVVDTVAGASVTHARIAKR